MPLIQIENVTKVYAVTKHRAGLRGAVADLFAPHRESIRAVSGISFAVEQGDIVGYIGPNGAGKSTTIKMLAGILLPTSGRITVAGSDPFANRAQNAARIGAVFGQRSQLWWDIPADESFDMFRHLYRVPRDRFERTMGTLRELLELDEFRKIPVRQLSLGQRMRAELAGALVHEPEVLYLDEPTIGMDVMVRERIREFIKRLNAEKRITVILTTHELHDVERLCSRIIVLDRGRIIHDGSIEAIRGETATERELVIELERQVEVDSVGAIHLAEANGLKARFRFDRNEVSAAEAIATLSRHYPVRDIRLLDPDIETVIRSLFERRRPEHVE